MTKDIVTRHFEYITSEEYSLFNSEDEEEYKDHAKVLEYIENKLYTLQKDDRETFIHLMLERQQSFVGVSILSDKKEYYNNIQDFLYTLSYICALFKIDLKKIINQLSTNYLSSFDLEYKNSIAFSYSSISNNTIPLNRNGNSILEMSQIVVLSKLLKQKKIFGTNLDNTTYSKIINYLTGYSHNTIRQDLSKNTNEIISKKGKIDNVIEVLNTIIKELEEEKKTIIE